DALNWSEPVELCPATKSAYRSSGGWHVNNNTLVAFINEWPFNQSPRGGRALYMSSTDGTTWSEPAPVMMKDGSEMKGIIEQDIHSIGNGRLVCAAHFSPGLYVNPIYTDDLSGVAGWVKGSFKCEDIGSTSREMEPSLFVNSSGQIVMIFRDQNSTFYKLASVSNDNGSTWSASVLTNFPDARTKQSAGNFADETSFIVGNPVTNKLRSPLAVALSLDGIQFNKAFLLKSGAMLTEPKYEGNAKRSGYHYPKSFVHDGYLYVTYSINKEEAELVRVPVSQLTGAQ
ncbi:MAG: exo-alpha-sialidase, partial [Treponema sp.]|nr:exo-alpha-sialidase [Treponema sp.]